MKSKNLHPSLSIHIHHGDKRSKGTDFAKTIHHKNLILTSYALLYRDSKTLEKIDWQGIVLDEAQNIKNPQSKQAQAVRQLKAGFRIALTGTPVENRLSELWAILDFLNPNFLGTQAFFQKRFATPNRKIRRSPIITSVAIVGATFYSAPFKNGYEYYSRFTRKTRNDRLLWTFLRTGKSV